MIDVGAVTKLLVATVHQSSGQLVGDGVAPEGGGWLSGQPNVSAFVPYSVVAFQGATLSDPALRYAEQTRSWTTTWRMSSYGGAREQCDWMATLARQAVDKIIKQAAGGYEVTMVMWGSLGPMTRNDAIDPPMWAVSDTFSLRCDA